MKRNHLPLGAKKMFSAASCLETAGNVRSGDFFDIGDVYNHRAGRQASGFSRRLNEDPATNLEFWQVQGGGARQETPWSLESNKSHHVKDLSRCYWKYLAAGSLRLN